MKFDCKGKEKPLQCEYLEIEETCNFDPYDNSPSYIYICNNPLNTDCESCQYMLNFPPII